MKVRAFVQPSKTLKQQKTGSDGQRAADRHSEPRGGPPPQEPITLTMASDVGERGRGDQAHSERARQVVILAAAFVAEVKRVLLLPLVGVAEQDHLTQEGVHDHVLVVDLFAARTEEGKHPKELGGGQEERREKTKRR